MHNRGSTTACALALVVLMAFAPAPATAHKVIGMAYAIGAEIEGEVGFSNGDTAETGTPVAVVGPDGERLGETVIEEDGLFRFLATLRVDHRFVVDLGAGHVVDVVLPADELPPDLGSGEASAAPEALPPATDPSGGTAAAASAPGLSATEIEALIRSAVADEVRPLRRELAMFQERATWRDAIGGIGAILGFFGIAAYAAVLRRRTRSA